MRSEGNDRQNSIDREKLKAFLDLLNIDVDIIIGYFESQKGKYDKQIINSIRKIWSNEIYGDCFKEIKHEIDLIKGADLRKSGLWGAQLSLKLKMYKTRSKYLINAIGSFGKNVAKVFDKIYSLTKITEIILGSLSGLLPPMHAVLEVVDLLKLLAAEQEKKSRDKQ